MFDSLLHPKMKITMPLTSDHESQRQLRYKFRLHRHLLHMLEGLLRVGKVSMAAFASLSNTDTATSSKPPMYGKCICFHNEKLMHRVLTNARHEVFISSTKQGKFEACSTDLDR